MAKRAVVCTFGQHGLQRGKAQRDPVSVPVGLGGFIHFQVALQVLQHAQVVERMNFAGYCLRQSAHPGTAQGIAWQQSTMDDGSTLVNSPRQLAKLIVGIPIAYGWTIGGEWLGMSKRRSLNGSVPGYGVTNLHLSSTAVAGLGQFSLGVYNLANRRYLDPASSAFAQDAIEQDQRQFRLRWILAF